MRPTFVRSAVVISCDCLMAVSVSSTYSDERRDPLQNCRSSSKDGSRLIAVVRRLRRERLRALQADFLERRLEIARMTQPPMLE